MASLGAGAIHAAAVGAHPGDTAVAIIFAVLAAAQVGWAALALIRSGWAVSLAGVAVNGPAVIGWAAAKSVGVGFVGGLAHPEPVGFADAAAAALAAVAVIGALMAVSRRAGWVSRPHPALVGVAGIAALSLTVPGIVTAGGHAHGDGGHGHGETDGLAASDPTHDMGDMPGMDHGHQTALAPKPYTGALPVDLGGVPGVTRTEQRTAEALVTRTVQRLPQFADYRVAEARGWHSIGDGFGPGSFEHFINWPTIDDKVQLNPDQPESLVYQVQNDGSRKLVAAMYMLPDTVPLDKVPDVGGALVQWHIHDNLCFDGQANAWNVGPIVAPDQPCPTGTFRFKPAPMIHVWIVGNPCGPFAALEGIAGGQILPGQTRLCDSAHGDGNAVF